MSAVVKVRLVDGSEWNVTAPNKVRDVITMTGWLETGPNATPVYKNIWEEWERQADEVVFLNHVIFAKLIDWT